MDQKLLIENFYEKEKSAKDKPFLRQPFGDRWEVTTWGEAGQMARRLATRLRSMGLPEKSHIGLVSKNCREWVIADLAIMMAGYVSVPFYATLTGDQIAEVLRLGDVVALFVGKTEVWDDMKNGVPADMPVIRFPHYKGNSVIDRGEDWHEVIKNNEPIQGEPKADIKDIWTIVFTSGTTGTPKGVVLTYEVLDSTKTLIDEANHLKVSKEGDNHFFSYLPLNHIAERVVVENTCIAHGGVMSFVESLDTFAKNLAETEPTVFFAVPRIWTKFQMGVLAKMPQKKLDTYLKIPILSGMVKKKIRKSLGLINSRGMLTGAAPMSESLKNWYKKLGIYISEGYGMTENCAICTFLDGRDNKPGSVGKAQPGVEMKTDPETDEVMMRAPYVMAGYYKEPAKTAETIDDGWLRTGDQGRIDEDGYLFLTGRVKDTFKTSKGKFIVPAPIEWEFGHNNDIEQICIVGIGMPQPMALIVPSEIGVAKSQNELKESLATNLTNVNKELPNYRKVSTIVVVKEPFSVENGLLTPTLKVKRSVMDQRYKDQYESWHEHPDAVVFE